MICIVLFNTESDQKNVNGTGGRGDSNWAQKLSLDLASAFDFQKN